MIKVLIVEDQIEKSNYIIMELEEVFKGKLSAVDTCNNCTGASLSLGKSYDLVLVDQRLGAPSADGKVNVGRDFVRLYQGNWPKSRVILYSGENESANVGGIYGIYCYSVKEMIVQVKKYARAISPTEPEEREIPEDDEELEECKDLSKHTILNKEWWSTGNKVRGIALLVSAVVGAVLVLVNADEMYQVKIAIPYHLKCFTLINDSINKPRFAQQDCVNRTVTYALLRMQARQETMMSRAMMDRADSVYHADSLKFEAMCRTSR